MNLDEMERFIDGCNDSILFKLNRKRRHPLHIKALTATQNPPLVAT